MHIGWGVRKQRSNRDIATSSEKSKMFPHHFLLPESNEEQGLGAVN